ncbi:hypothetical protein ACIBO6_27570 [Streptomyces luteogriseus]|uniref:hypothetical protein n=1 Tax=Streptomyces luteogriseus TaxID=68233 RepID=UPI0037960683
MSLRETGGALAVASATSAACRTDSVFGSLLIGPAGLFSLPGMRVGLVIVAALLATALLARLLLPRG